MTEDTALTTITKTDELPSHIAIFLQAIIAYPGSKHPVGSYYSDAYNKIEDYENAPHEDPSWKIAENNGWAECLGSHKWKALPAGELAYYKHRVAELSESKTTQVENTVPPSKKPEELTDLEHKVLMFYGILGCALSHQPFPSGATKVLFGVDDAEISTVSERLVELGFLAKNKSR